MYEMKLQKFQVDQFSVFLSDKNKPRSTKITPVTVYMLITSFKTTAAIVKPNTGHKKSHKLAFTAFFFNNQSQSWMAKIETTIASHPVPAQNLTSK